MGRGGGGGSERQWLKIRPEVPWGGVKNYEHDRWQIIIFFSYSVYIVYTHYRALFYRALFFV